MLTPHPTRRTALDVVAESRIRATPTVGAGMVNRADARAIGAVSAPSIRANGGDSLARMMQKNRGENRRVRTVARADVRSMSAAAIQRCYDRAAFAAARAA